ncbi:MAG: TetR/AcrR family transcriptional regulator [Bacteroidia bacterium]
MPRTLNQPYNEMVDKAKHLFWQKGFRAVSNEDLANALGVSKSTVYNRLGKEQLFIDSLTSYFKTVTDPTMETLRNEKGGLKTFENMFFGLIDALFDGYFPRNCLMVNTCVEMRADIDEITPFYEPYFANIRESYIVVLERAFELGEIKSRASIPNYVEFLFGAIFTISVFSKIKTREELKQHISDQLELIN